MRKKTPRTPTAKKKPAKKKPPTKEKIATLKSKQLNLFQEFVRQEERDSSNAIEQWEAIPKYFFTHDQVEKLRTPDGLAPSFVWNYTHQDKPHRVTIQPALLEQPDGSFKAFFPGTTEELVEEVLIKMLAERLRGYHDDELGDSWVLFSLRDMFRELMRRGRTRNLQELKHAIDVLSGCVITLERDGRKIYAGGIISSVFLADRNNFFDDAERPCTVLLNPFLTHAVSYLEYRQFNYTRYMTCNEQLTRWLYKRLIHRYRQANHMNDYHCLFSTVRDASGLLQISGRAARRKILSALDELVEVGVIKPNYRVEKIKNGNTIVDIKYTLYPTRAFIAEQIAANERIKQAKILPHKKPVTLEHMPDDDEEDRDW